MFGLSLVSHSIGDIIKKANLLFFEFDEFIEANVYDDKIICVYLYPPNSKHDRLGDLVIFQKGFLGLPKTVFIANNSIKNSKFQIILP